MASMIVPYYVHDNISPSVRSTDVIAFGGTRPPNMELDIPIYGATNSDQLIINWTSKYEPGIYRCGAALPWEPEQPLLVQNKIAPQRIMVGGPV